MSVDLPAGYWRADATGDRIWHAPQFFAAGEAVTIRIWPAATVVARLSGAEPLPAEVRVRFAFGEAVCPVAEREFRCTLPAGTHTLHVRTRGYVSTILEDVYADPRETRDIGTLRLRAGQSITGRIELPRLDGVRMEDVVVSATTVGTVRETKPGARGWFVLGDLAPGRYEVRARHGRRLISEVRPVPVSAPASCDI